LCTEQAPMLGMRVEIDGEAFTSGLLSLLDGLADGGEVGVLQARRSDLEA